MTKSNIRIESINKPPEQPAEEMPPTTEAEGMEQVMQEMKVSEPLPEPVAPAEPKPVAPAEPKPKRKPRAKKAAKELVVEATEPEVTPEPEVMPEPVEKPPSPKAEKMKAEKVQCPACGKLMSAKTMKYSHKCKAKKVPENNDILETEYFTSPQVKDVIEETITQRRISAQALRVQKRNEKIAKLAAQAF